MVCIVVRKHKDKNGTWCLRKADTRQQRNRKIATQKNTQVTIESTHYIVCERWLDVRSIIQIARLWIQIFQFNTSKPSTAGLGTRIKAVYGRVGHKWVKLVDCWCGDHPGLGKSIRGSDVELDPQITQMFILTILRFEFPNILRFEFPNILLLLCVAIVTNLSVFL